MTDKYQRTIFTAESSPKVSRRQRAHAMYLEGSTMAEVMTATGLRPATASMYLWEAQRKAKRQGLIKDEDLLT